ncbi:MAG TPA: zinc ABC transporter substrate-binding protein [Alphaproteobacteria bacterium]|nr:zinc ABC transporter substrate-binding protein [Alphaproteobacteria bacterium]
MAAGKPSGWKRALLAVMAFGALTTPAAAESWSIVTTTAQVGDIVRGVAGDEAAVESLMGAGVDPHLYRPTRSDVAALARADLVFYNGLHLEGQMYDVLERLALDKPVVPVTERLEEARLLADATGVSRFDPHVWMDVSVWMEGTATVAEVLAEADPPNAETYRRNAEAYRAELARLDAYVRDVLASVPEGSRVLVTAHDAFNYMGDAYGLEVVGIQGISTESEAGLQRIEEIVDLLVERGIAAVFVETSVSERNVRALIDGAAAQGHEVRIGGTLYSDAMGEPGTYTGTYVGMIDHNATVIARALGGSAPPGGLNGRLDIEMN